MTSNRQHSGSLIGGTVLIVLGVFFLLNQFLSVDILGTLWPIVVILFGAAFFVGMVMGGSKAGGLAVPGSMFVILGLILLAQNANGSWASWSYAWALFAPTGTGIGIVIQSWWSDKPQQKREGYRVIGIGLVLFFVFGAFFEIMFDITGSQGRQQNATWPIVLIVLGIAAIFSKLINLNHLVDRLPPHTTRGGMAIPSTSQV
jgi:hypothetical protein